VAKAGCLLARCGAWGPARCSWLLALALRRDRLGKTLTPAAGAFWLCAIAEAGETLETATDNGEYCSQQLLDCAEALGCSSPDVSSISSMGRALWALQSLGLQGERGLGEALLETLSGAEHACITPETWALLREVHGATPGPDVDAEAAEDTSGSQSPFLSTSWQHGIAEAAASEARIFKASARGEQLKIALRSVASLSEEGAQDLISEMEDLAQLGPYVVAALFRERGVALDFDAHQSPTGRALRRQQWAAICPEVRVAEISLAIWDLDVDGRTDLVRRRLEGIEDDVEGGSDDDDS